MNRELRALATLVLGMLVLKLVVGGRYRMFLKPRMHLPLLLAAALLLAGAAAALAPLVVASLPHVGGRERGREAEGAHLPASRIGLLVLLPVFLLAVTTPAPLGAYAAGLKGRSAPVAPANLFPAMPPAINGAVPMSLGEFLSRALYDPGRSLRGVTVRLVGFAAADPGAPPGGYLLVRFALVCCAADALPYKVHIRGTGGAPNPDTWLRVVGIWRPQQLQAADAFVSSLTATLDARAARPIPEPAEPYD